MTDNLTQSSMSFPSITTNHTLAGKSGARSVQLVLNHTQKGVIATWMVESELTNGRKHLCARTVRNFPNFFRCNTKANLQRASRYWKSRENILSRYRNKSRKTSTVITRCTSKGLKIYTTKASTGRGRKRAPWVTILHKELMEDFDIMRKAGVRLNVSLLKTLALRIIRNGNNEMYGPEVRDGATGRLLSECISTRWIQRFMQNISIVSRSQCGKLMMSPAKREIIEREVAYHLGIICREFRDKTLLEDDVMNADETHFVIHMHNHKTLARKGEDQITFADVVSGDEGMTMLVLLTGGRSSSIQPSFMIFKKENSSYPIRGVPDDIPGVSYRTGPKGWMDSRVFAEWLNENRAVPHDHSERKRVLYMDNCSGHAMRGDVKKALAKNNIELRFFPANATDLVQPANSYLIQKFKAAWVARWDYKVLEMIQRKMWVDPRKGSGKLVNPGKSYFSKLAANYVRDVNSARHKDGVYYSRRTMTRCGLSLNEEGKWEEGQLSKQLRQFICKYRENFEGTPVNIEQDLEGKATETDDDDAMGDIDAQDSQTTAI